MFVNLSSWKFGGLWSSRTQVFKAGGLSLLISVIQVWAVCSPDACLAGNYDAENALVQQAMKAHRGNDLTLAEQLYKRAISMAQGSPASNDSEGASLQLNCHLCLGDLYFARNEESEAGKQYCHALTIAEKLYGDSDPFLLPSLNRLINLGISSSTLQGKLRYVLPNVSRAIGIKSRFLPDVNGELMNDYQDWHSVLSANGMFTEDEPVVRKLYESRKTSPNFLRNKNTPGLINELARDCKAAGKLDEALSRSREAIQVANSQSSLQAATAKVQAAVRLFSLGQTDESKRLINQVLVESKAEFSPAVVLQVLNVGVYECLSNAPADVSGKTSGLEQLSSLFLFPLMELLRAHKELDPTDVKWTLRIYADNRPHFKELEKLSREVGAMVKNYQRHKDAL